MKYEFKKGDKLRVINNVNASGDLPLGKIFTVGIDMATDSSHDLIYVKSKDGKQDNWCIYRFERVIEGKAGRPKKVKPVVKHIVLKDSCSNFIGIYENYEDASKQKPSVGDTYSIYQMTKVASIKTDAVVKITKVGGKKK